MKVLEKQMAHARRHSVFKTRKIIKQKPGGFMKDNTVKEYHSHDKYKEYHSHEQGVSFT